ncbi:MAG: hypothetical protein J2P30_00090 [Actinobacteria bacterium]|nr:hypothetical protein [Actinomycetota bacterium]
MVHRAEPGAYGIPQALGEHHQLLRDAAMLKAAAEVIERRTRNPRGFVTMVLVRVLRNSAAKLTAKAGHGQHGNAASGAG